MLLPTATREAAEREGEGGEGGEEKVGGRKARQQRRGAGREVKQAGR